MSNFSSQYDLTALNSFRVTAYAQHFIKLGSLAEILAAVPQIQNYAEWIILGGGSNVLFVSDYAGLVVYPQLFGIELVGLGSGSVLIQDSDSVLVKVAASENWHDFVLAATRNGWFGLENLALIPGTVGAAPVQNIGAYGVEVGERIEQVECVDLHTGEILLMDNAACDFAYRDSFFKQQQLGRYLITSVTFRLSKRTELCLTYQPLAKAFAGKDQVTPLDVLHRVCAIRAEKLPDPKLLPNAGSFFKNPLVSSQQFHQLKNAFPNLVGYSAGSEYKLAAAWLIEHAGFKGLRVENIGVHTQQALVLVNYAETNGLKIWQLAERIQQEVLQKFAVSLEPEVRLLGNI